MEPKRRRRRRTRTSASEKQLTPSTPPDLISSLPLDLLLSILSLLPLRDAARATALSKNPWGLLFHSLPRLVFDDSILGDEDYQLPDVVYSVLASRGFQSVSGCEIDCGFSDDDELLDAILHGLCENGVLEELILKNTNGADHEPLLVLPHDILSCRSLARLELEHCTFDVPDGFEGLQCLKSLVLRKVELSDCELERLLSCCRALESLLLSDCYVLEKVNVWSSSLLSLEIGSSSMFDVSVKDSGLLRDVAVGFLYGEEMLEGGDLNDYEDTLDRERRKFVRFFTELGHVEVLRLQFGEEFSDVFEQMPERLPKGILLPNLKKLVMILDLPDSSFHSLLFCLLNSCPNLEELGIQVKGCSNVDSPPNFVTTFWNRQTPAVCVKHHLKHAWFDQMDYCLEEFLDVVKFLLLNAEVLERITIKHDEDLENLIDVELSLLIQPWASPSAVLEFKT